MPHPFFPGLLFGWAFYLVLTGLMVVAAYTDLRRMIIPKQLTLGALALGVVFNLVRGAWVGANGEGTGVWLLGANGLFVGALDGLLYAAAGFAIGFGLFLIMWLLNTCGGGDVKLFAALGAWIGPALSVPVLAGTIVLVIVFSIARLAWGALTRGFGRTARVYSSKEAAKTRKQLGKDPAAAARKPRLMTYSLPAAVSVAVILLWVLRTELHLPVPVPVRPDAPLSVSHGEHETANR
jgi:Flp pilus assembly protein protease CpaA